MKPLANHVLIYDKDCPLCTTYTKLFLKYGFLDENGRKAYQEMDFFNTLIDAEIAKNKIALYNSVTGEVSYGIDALTKVLGHRIPFISFCMKWKAVHWFMTQFYSLISYNRKIIIPVNCKNLTSCNPSTNWFWRIAFVLLCLLPIQFATTTTHQLLAFVPFKQTTLLHGNMAFLSLLFLQILSCKTFGEKNVYDYIGHFSIISAVGACMLTVLFALMKWFIPLHLSFEILGSIGCGLIFVWMLFEHHRRMKLLDMSQRLTGSCIFFMIAMAGIFYFR
ncbi:MAG: hypothetical protein IPJ31_04180 [Bacteroidetes bacterium]|nr:hypothetical protein [Bacteroidota bacterium]MBP6314091.1 hypothetical protein [Chitinophagaceae bacterium]